jgi:large subunit ribosomal protein L29
MRADEIREMSDADIRTRIAELEEERFRLKFRSATETLEDPLRLRWIRRDIARLKTVLRERALQSEPAGPAGPAATGDAGASKAPGGAKTSAARKTRASATR